jgi:hypothetical protein
MPETKIVRFNLNQSVRVRLTEHGLALHRADWEGYVASLPERARASQVYRPPLIDADGFWTTQCWSLMQLFGPHIGMARPNAFDLNVELVLSS